ncbi:hypothetical protein PR048_026189 [Dryococelus australis]|uniref:Uncharacterized protein n=1 Tax=Dryococelus australis TaxID=614101 RepID=A0ABQ9GKM3_9NEOP|nr:hypothetical protein PR048_026189 [Dryococelus australis]
MPRKPFENGNRTGWCSIPGWVAPAFRARGNRAGPCRWSAGLLGDLPFPPPFNSRAAPLSPRFTLIGSQDLDVKSHTNLFTSLRFASLVKFLLRTTKRYLVIEKEDLGLLSRAVKNSEYNPLTVTLNISEALPKIYFHRIPPPHRLNKLNQSLISSANEMKKVVTWPGSRVGQETPLAHAFLKHFKFRTGDETEILLVLTELNIRTPHNLVLLSTWGSGGAVASALASHGDPGPILGGFTPDFRMWESFLTMSLAGGFSRGTPVFPALAFQRHSILGSHFMSCPGMTGTYGSQLESPSLGECCLALGSLPTRQPVPADIRVADGRFSGSSPGRSTVDGERGELLPLVRAHPQTVTTSYAVSGYLIKRPEA